MSEPNEYERGVRDGEVNQQLHEHTSRLDKINGSTERVAVRLGIMSEQNAELIQGIARIDQAMTADKETVKQTAAALRDQADVAGQRDTARWTPFNRLIVAVTGLGGVSAIVYGFLQLH